MQGIATIDVCFPIRSTLFDYHCCCMSLLSTLKHPIQLGNFIMPGAPPNIRTHIPDSWMNESLGLSSHQGQSQNSVPAPRPVPKARFQGHPNPSWRQDDWPHGKEGEDWLVWHPFLCISLSLATQSFLLPPSTPILLYPSLPLTSYSHFLNDPFSWWERRGILCWTTQGRGNA